MTERDEQVLVNTVCALLEHCAGSDKIEVQNALGLTDWQLRRYKFYKLKPDDKVKVAMHLLDEYSYNQLSPGLREIIEKEITEIFHEELTDFHLPQEEQITDDQNNEGEDWKKGGDR
jgi:hypothetical protein